MRYGMRHDIKDWDKVDENIENHSVSHEPYFSAICLGTYVFTYGQYLISVLITLQGSDATPAPHRILNLTLCRIRPLACFNSGQVDKGPRLDRQPVAEDDIRTDEAIQDPESENEEDQGICRFFSFLCFWDIFTLKFMFSSHQYYMLWP